MESNTNANPKGLGYYPQHYEPKIHGAYYPWRFYGKVDKRFRDLKVNEIWSWFGRRSYTPGSMYNACSRAMWRYNYKWVDTKVGISAPWFHLAFSAMLFSYIIFFPRFHYERRRKYH